MAETVLMTPEQAEAWQRSWDSLEETFIPDRDSRLARLVDVFEAMASPDATVIDLACGTGSVTRRVLERMPDVRSIAVDVDPVLLTIASATFAHDERVQVRTADLRGPSWLNVVHERQVDAVLTATALHWLAEEVVRRLYRELAALIRPGGVFAHLELMPLAQMPRLGAALAELNHKRRRRSDDAGQSDWDAWWQEAAGDPALRSAANARRTVFESSYPTEEFSPPAQWHVEALYSAGFTEAGAVWRDGAAAIVAAVR